MEASISKDSVAASWITATTESQNSIWLQKLTWIRSGPHLLNTLRKKSQCPSLFPTVSFENSRSLALAQSQPPKWTLKLLLLKGNDLSDRKRARGTCYKTLQCEMLLVSQPQCSPANFSLFPFPLSFPFSCISSQHSVVPQRTVLSPPTIFFFGLILQMLVFSPNLLCARARAVWAMALGSDNWKQEITPYF